MQPFQFGFIRTQRKYADIPTRVSIQYILCYQSCSSCRTGSNPVSSLSSLIHRSLSMLHRLEELDLGNNELYSLVSCFFLDATKACSQNEQNKTFPISFPFLYCPSNLASLENSFHVLSHRWEEDHLLWALVFSCNLMRAVKCVVIYWQIKRSQAAKKWLFMFFILFWVHSLVM